MKVIKLDAIDSTNDFLKRLLLAQSVENYIVVIAKNQTKGKGQMGSTWDSEADKNLIMSMLVKDFLKDINHIFDLSIIISLSIIDSLELLEIPKLSIKWPNDIMSDTKKIGGILIENSIKSNGSISSVVGLGLNVNQTDFIFLPKASSLALVCNRSFNIDELLFLIVENIKNNIIKWDGNSNLMREKYINLLFRKGGPMPFQNSLKQNFMGVIIGVSQIGKLQILLENDSISEFDIKEIQLLY